MGHAVVGFSVGLAGLLAALALGAPAWGAAGAYLLAGNLGLGLSVAAAALRSRRAARHRPEPAHLAPRRSSST